MNYKIRQDINMYLVSIVKLTSWEFIIILCYICKYEYFFYSYVLYIKINGKLRESPEFLVINNIYRKKKLFYKSDITIRISIIVKRFFLN